MKKPGRVSSDGSKIKMTSRKKMLRKGNVEWFDERNVTLTIHVENEGNGQEIIVEDKE
jgi:hypothetical protein